MRLAHKGDSLTQTCEKVTDAEIMKRHQNLGHVGTEGVLASFGAGTDCTRDRVQRLLQKCIPCRLGNARQKKIPRRLPESTERGCCFGDRVEHDLTFMPTRGHLTHTDILSVMKDRFTGTPSLAPLKNKSDAASHLSIWDRKYGKMNVVCTDNGGEFVGHRYQSMCNLKS